MEELIKAVKVTFASAYAYQLKSHFYHWNVEGPNFKQYHDLFGQIYDMASENIDALAEEIRALGAYTPGSFSRFSELSQISEENMIPDAITMCNRLLSDTYILMNLYSQAFELSEQNRTYGLSDFLAGEIDKLNKIKWFLTATTKTAQLTPT